MKQKGDINKYYHYAFPIQAALVTCDDEKGKTNAITIAWHTTISKKPPLYGISVGPSRYSHDLINKSKEFVVNFAPYNILKQVNFCGTRSGRNTDKIKEAGLTLLPCEVVKTKLIKECFAHLECKLNKEITLGDHTFFVGEVVNLLEDENALSDGIIDNKNIKPVFYLGKSYYSTIDDRKDGF